MVELRYIKVFRSIFSCVPRVMETRITQMTRVFADLVSYRVTRKIRQNPRYLRYLRSYLLCQKRVVPPFASNCCWLSMSRINFYIVGQSHQARFDTLN